MVSRIGQVAADEAAFVELARASLQGVDLPAEVEAFVRNVQPSPQEPASQPAANAAAQDTTAAPPPPGEQTGGAQERRNPNPRDPRRNGLDGTQNQGARPRPVVLSNDILRLATLAVGQVARQSLRQTQASSLPAMAAAVNRLQEQAYQPDVQASSIQEQARQISNTTYDLGCLLLELSLATTNLANAAGGNAGPLVSAQTGFLAADGTHAHVTNRVPSMLSHPMGGMGAMPGGPMPGGMRFNPMAFSMGQQAATARTGATGAGAPGQATAGVAAAAAGAAAGAAPTPGGRAAPAAAGGGGGGADRSGFPPAGMMQPPRTRGMDTASPLAHAYFNAITQDDETRSRHMRLPVRLADGSHFRLDMSPVVNAVETLILSAPQEVIAQTLRNSVPVPMSGPEDRSLRELMTSSQTDEQRRQIYLSLTQPILAGVTEHLQAYFQHLYRVAPPRQPGEEQAAIRPTRRAASRPVPSLTHPFAMVTNPARDILRTLPRQGMDFPGAQLQVDMVLEGPMDVPITAQEVLQAQMANMLQAGLQQQGAPPTATAGSAAAGTHGTPNLSAGQTSAQRAAQMAAVQQEAARANLAQLEAMQRRLEESQRERRTREAAQQAAAQEEAARTHRVRMEAIQRSVEASQRAGMTREAAQRAAEQQEAVLAREVQLEASQRRLEELRHERRTQQAATGEEAVTAHRLRMEALQRTREEAQRAERTREALFQNLTSQMGRQVRPTYSPHQDQGSGAPSQGTRTGAAATPSQPAAGSASAAASTASAVGDNPASTVPPRAMFGSAAAGPPRSGVVPLGEGGPSIDMEWFSGMLGYPVMGPDGQVYSGRQPSQPGQAAAPTSNAGENATAVPPATTAATATTTSSTATAASPPATAPNPSPAQTPTAGSTASEAPQAAAVGTSNQAGPSSRSIAASGQGDEQASGARDEAADPTGGSDLQKEGAKDGGRGLGSSLPSRKRTSPSGKHHPHAAAESQKANSKEGPSDAGRDGKKQKVQDTPSTSTTVTDRPGAEEATADPSNTVRRATNSSRAPVNPSTQPVANGAGGGLANMMRQMMDMPGMQEALQSPEVEQLTSSLFNGQRGRQAGAGQQGAGGGGGRQQGQLAPGLGSLFQAMMPLAQQMLGGGAPPRSRGSGAASGDAVALSSSASDSDDMPELCNLPEEDAERWRKIIRGDREKAEHAPKPLSSNYLLATNSKTEKPSSNVEIADLD